MHQLPTLVSQRLPILELIPMFLIHLLHLGTIFLSPPSPIHLKLLMWLTGHLGRCRSLRFHLSLQLNLTKGIYLNHLTKSLAPSSEYTLLDLILQYNTILRHHHGFHSQIIRTKYQILIKQSCDLSHGLCSLSLSNKFLSEVLYLYDWKKILLEKCRELIPGHNLNLHRQTSFTD